jgi:hypothetical protein
LSALGWIICTIEGGRLWNRRFWVGSLKHCNFHYPWDFFFVTTCDCSFKDSPLILEQAVNLESLSFRNDTEYS